MARVELIMAKEEVAVSEEGKRAIVETSEGDLRKAITTLQSSARLKGEGEVSRTKYISLF
jgi:replication factor C subunit 2/4